MAQEHPFLIAERHQEIEQLNKLWVYIKNLDETVGLKMETFKELQSKISSRINFCERSIRDHS